jgi:ABC-type sugar transport system ATPase subunit
MRATHQHVLRPMPTDQAMTLYELRDRVFVGSSIGYYKMNVIETFEDRDLALKECENIRRNNSQSYAHVVTVES